MSVGVPLRQIGLTNLLLVVVLLATAVLLIALGDQADGRTVLGCAIGVVVGGGATTAIVQIKSGDTNGNPPAPPS